MTRFSLDPLRVLIIGDKHVGKTQLIETFANYEGYNEFCIDITRNVFAYVTVNKTIDMSLQIGEYDIDSWKLSSDLQKLPNGYIMLLYSTTAQSTYESALKFFTSLDIITRSKFRWMIASTKNDMILNKYSTIKRQISRLQTVHIWTFDRDDVLQAFEDLLEKRDPWKERRTLLWAKLQGVVPVSNNLFRELCNFL